MMLSDGHGLSLTPPSGKASAEDWSHVSSFPLQERTLHDVTDEVIRSCVWKRSDAVKATEDAQPVRLV
jgi:hypothetical protein